MMTIDMYGRERSFPSNLGTHNIDQEADVRLWHHGLLPEFGLICRFIFTKLRPFCIDFGSIELFRCAQHDECEHRDTDLLDYFCSVPSPAIIAKSASRCCFDTIRR